MYQYVEPHNYNPTLGDLITAGVHVFNDWWGTHVPEYKNELEKKILHRYWFYQIGQETPDMFVHYLNQTLEEIMPYYNQLYASELIKINPLVNHAITTDHRSIENLVKDAKTNTDKYGKAVRDFVEATGTSTTGNVAGTTNVTGTIDKNAQTVYNKHGDETTHGEHSLTATRDQTRTDNASEKQITDSDEKSHATQATDGTTSTDATVANTGTITEKIDWQETTDNDGTTSTDRTATTDGTSSSTDLYSDTPQKSLDVSSGQYAIRKDYLTNARFINGSTHDSTTEKIQGQSTDDTSVTHGGTNTTTNDTQEKTDKQVTENQTITTDGTTDKDITVTTTKEDTEHLDATSKDVGDRDEAKKWEEHGGETTTGHTTTTQGTTTSTATVGKTDTEGRSTASTDTAEGLRTSEAQTKTVDVGETTQQQGFMNISASALLDAFRKTFLNIDREIMEELSSCFLTVY